MGHADLHTARQLILMSKQLYEPQPFTERHTGVNITETIDTMNEEYSIPDHKVHCIAVAWLIVEPVGPQC